MKLAILYTSYRQFRELDFLPEIFHRAPRLLAEASVIYHSNNAKIAPAEIEEKLARVPFSDLDFIYAPRKNEGGYPYGQFEAICDAWDKLKDRFDWVIHLHPDVFVIQEDLLFGALEKARAARADMLVTPTFGLKAASFATDFFIFNPSAVPRSLFESYLSLNNAPNIVPLENLFYMEAHRAGIKYEMAHRFAHGHYHRDIDLLGLWHEHQLNRVESYLKRPWRRWPTTFWRCLQRPYATTRFSLNWLERELKRLPQDSLAKQLTAL